MSSVMFIMFYVRDKPYTLEDQKSEFCSPLTTRPTKGTTKKPYTFCSEIPQCSVGSVRKVVI